MAHVLPYVWIALIGLAFQTSRNSMVPFIEGGQVFVNGKLITSNGYEPKDGDIISVRGKGRFRYEGVSRQQKKRTEQCEIATLSVGSGGLRYGHRCITVRRNGDFYYRSI